MKTACLGKFLSLSYEPKRLFQVGCFELFFDHDVKPWGESAGNGTPYCSVNRFYWHFITSLKRSKDEKQKRP